MPENEPEFECPNCHEPVELDWKACPGCGAEFDSSEEGEAEAQAVAPPAKAPPAVSASTAGEPVDAEGAVDELDALEKQIERVTAPPAAARPPPATARAPPAAAARGAPPSKAKAASTKAPAGASKGSLAKLGGMLGFAGLMLFLGGLVGAIVALNYDTWVQGLSINSVGILQLSATLGMLVVGAVGGFLLFRGMGKAKRRGTAAQ